VAALGNAGSTAAATGRGPESADSLRDRLLRPGNRPSRGPGLSARLGATPYFSRTVNMSVIMTRAGPQKGGGDHEGPVFGLLHENFRSYLAAKPSFIFFGAIARSVGGHRFRPHPKRRSNLIANRSRFHSPRKKKTKLAAKKPSGEGPGRTTKPTSAGLALENVWFGVWLFLRRSRLWNGGPWGRGGYDGLASSRRRG